MLVYSVIYSAKDAYRMRRMSSVRLLLANRIRFKMIIFSTLMQHYLYYRPVSKAYDVGTGRGERVKGRPDQR
jgi:hypothetical protein